jgi:FkbM family methyltransferase
LQIASSSTTLPQGISQPMLLRVAVGNSGRVVVVEPFKPSIEFVKSYAEFNKLKNIEFHNNAIWKTKGKVEFLYRPEMPSWNRIDAVAQDYKDSNWKQPFDSQAIEAETIDNIIKKSNIDIKKLSLINMTINGGEFDALAGAENALANEVSFSFPVQNELTARSGIIDFFINRGYSVYLQHAPVAKKQEQFLVALATKKKVSFESDKVSVQVYNKGTAARFKITIDKSNKVLSENDFKKSYCWF